MTREAIRTIHRAKKQLAQEVLHRAQIHIAEAHPECVQPQFGNPHRDAVRILDACETLVGLVGVGEVRHG